MNNIQKMGGIAAILESITFIVGFALFVTVLSPLAEENKSAIETVEFLIDHQAVVYIWNLIIYVAFGVFLVVLTFALHERLKDAAIVPMRTATGLGLIWSGLVIASGMVSNIGIAAVIDIHDTDPSQAATVWLAIDAVSDGLGGGNEVVGGLWVLLVSWSALQVNQLPKALNYLGIVIGVAGVVTLVPPLTDVGAIFGLGLIVWFFWVGLVLYRTSPQPA